MQDEVFPPWENLPLDILLAVARLAGVEATCCMIATCRSWRRDLQGALNDDEWQRAFERLGGHESHFTDSYRSWRDCYIRHVQGWGRGRMRVSAFAACTDPHGSAWVSGVGIAGRRVVAAGHSRKISVHDRITGAWTKVRDGAHAGAVTCLDVCGRWAVTCAQRAREDYVATLWDTHRNPSALEITGHVSRPALPSGALSLCGVPPSPACVCFAGPEAAFVAVGHSGTGTIQLVAQRDWNSPGASQPCQLLTHSTGAPHALCPLTALAQHAMASAHLDGTVCVWDLRAGADPAMRLQGHGDGVSAVAGPRPHCDWAPEQARRGQGHGHASRLGGASSRAAAAGRRVLRASIDVPTHGETSQGLPCTLLSGDLSGQLRSWDLRQSGVPLRAWEGHGAWVRGAAVWARWGATVAKGEPVRLWDLESGVATGAVEVAATALCVACDNEGLAVGCADGTVAMLSV